MKVIRREFHLVCPSTNTNTPIRSSTPVPSPVGVTEHLQDLTLVSTSNRCQEPTNSDNDVQEVSYELLRSESFPTRSKKKKVVLHKCSTVRSRSKRFTSKTKVHEAAYNSEQGSPPLKRQRRCKISGLLNMKKMYINKRNLFNMIVTLSLCIY
ncbi:uncharacterized protein LOC143907051 isoform X2 [Temnothorax americanus]